MVDAQKDYPSANLSVSWINNPSDPRGSLDMSRDPITLRPILLAYNSSSPHPPIGLGFFANRSSKPTANFFYLVILLATSMSDSSGDEWEIDASFSSVKILWCANRNRPVGENAVLNFTAGGELVLKDADDSVVWSTNTSSRGVSRMELTREANLVLLDNNNHTVWQSFDYPTDTWLPNQKINDGQRLIAGNSTSNLSPGVFFLSFSIQDGLCAFFNLNPPKKYDQLEVGQGMDLGNWYMLIAYNTYAVFLGDLTLTNDFRYIALDPSGLLILYRVERLVALGNFYSVKEDIKIFGDCSPTICGHYGVCLDHFGCQCPQDYSTGSQSFNPFQNNIECPEMFAPLSCKEEEVSQSQAMVEIANVTYFDFFPTIFNTSLDKCKEACLSNCSCKVSIFWYETTNSSGNCSLQLDEIYSFEADKYSNSYAFIKVEKVPVHRKHALLAPILAGGLGFAAFVVGTWFGYRKLKNTNEEEEEGDDQVIDRLLRFTFRELKFCTQGFKTKLGQGGFGVVYDGVLRDGTKVAIKHLESMGQGKKEFLAELNTIGKVNHFNLVRLIGYCAEKSNRLLVYEYMCNGSLDKWIFNLEKAKMLGWEVRRKIIHGVAKGLEYLHEECTMNIIHFDIKPQNILLDYDFNAKISDFGLSKLINKDQSIVLTALKGTPGYLAPELFGGLPVSVKVDVYSFGIMILEILCGRKNLDLAKSMPLINIIKQKAEEDRLCDLIEVPYEDIRSHKEEAIKMIKLGLSCLQSQERRPCMSTIVKVIEGSLDLDTINKQDFLVPSHLDGPHMFNLDASSLPESSLLSGPR
ncbi:Non-specific serine/threonine protein kinase [Bertholletia excelsa]